MFDAPGDAFGSRVNADARMIRRKPGDIEQLSLNRIAARAVHIALSLSADSDRLQIGVNLQDRVLELTTRPREEARSRRIKVKAG